MDDALNQGLEFLREFIEARPSIPAFVGCAFLVTPPLTLLHELGHALASRREVGGAVKVVVGHGPNLLAMRIGDLRVDVNLWMFDPTRLDGYTIHDTRRATASNIFWIAVAGPAASLLAATVFAVAYSAAPTSGFSHDLLWTATLDAIGTAILCAIPMRLREGRNGREVWSDGRIALYALRSGAPSAP